jgi:hypothetical protein
MVNSCNVRKAKQEISFIWITWAALLLIVIATEACSFQTIHDNRDPRRSVVTRSLSVFSSQNDAEPEATKWQK